LLLRVNPLELTLEVDPVGNPVCDAGLIAHGAIVLLQPRPRCQLCLVQFGTPEVETLVVLDPSANPGVPDAPVISPILLQERGGA
jgi:hypothetical protein